MCTSQSSPTYVFNLSFLDGFAYEVLEKVSFNYSSCVLLVLLHKNDMNIFLQWSISPKLFKAVLWSKVIVLIRGIASNNFQKNRTSLSWLLLNVF